MLGRRPAHVVVHGVVFNVRIMKISRRRIVRFSAVGRGAVAGDFFLGLALLAAAPVAQPEHQVHQFYDGQGRRSHPQAHGPTKIRHKLPRLK